MECGEVVFNGFGTSGRFASDELKNTSILITLGDKTNGAFSSGSVMGSVLNFSALSEKREQRTPADEHGKFSRDFTPNVMCIDELKGSFSVNFDAHICAELLGFFGVSGGESAW